MSWLYYLLDMGTHGEVWGGFQAFDLGNWMELSAFNTIGSQVGRREKGLVPQDGNVIDSYHHTTLGLTKYVRD